MRHALGHQLNVFAASLASVVRPVGGRSAPRMRTPNRPLELYEFEACPYCRKVREAISMLALDTLVFPCPKGGTRYRQRAITLGGKSQFPLLVDSNTGASLYDSDAIVKYLFETYGDGSVPMSLALGSLTNAQSFVASALRLGFGTRELPSQTAALPIELWAFESCPYSRLVRERLCSMELAYLLHPTPHGATSARVGLLERGGKVQVPYIDDPNTGAKLYESDAILAYLSRTYGAG